MQGNMLKSYSVEKYTENNLERYLLLDSGGSVVAMLAEVKPPPKGSKKLGCLLIILQTQNPMYTTINAIITCLLIQLLLIFIPMQLASQVSMQFEEYLIGRAETSDLTAVSVVNRVGVEIDYIYKAWATTKEGEEVLRIQSEVLTQSSGMANYHRNDKFDRWGRVHLDYKVVKQQVDLSTYTGKLIFYAQLVHPLDTTSIIARQTKDLMLVNGIYSGQDGNPAADPRLVSFDFRLGFDVKFNLDSLFKRMIFTNENPAACCLPLRYEVVQGEELIYAAELEAFCIPPGVHTMDESQIKSLNIRKDLYKEKGADTPITLHYRLGDMAGSRTISSVLHHNFDLSYSRYEHPASGLQFSFVNHASASSVLSASSFTVTFDENDVVEKMELLDVPEVPEYSQQDDLLGLYHPFHTRIAREDFNGVVSITVLPRDNFTESQWRGLLAFHCQTDASSIQVYNCEGVQILYPLELVESNVDNRNRGVNEFPFLIMDQERVISYYTFFYSRLEAERGTGGNFRGSLDIPKALSDITYNGIQLEFDFLGSQVKGLNCKATKVIGKALRQENYDKYRRYHALVNKWSAEGNPIIQEPNKIDQAMLDSVLNLGNMPEASAVPAYIVLTPNDIHHLQSDTFSWDSVGIQFTYRLLDKHQKSVVAGLRKEQYDYKSPYNIESSAYTSSGVEFSSQSGRPNGGTQEEQVLSFHSSFVEIRPSSQRIELSKLHGVPKDPEWLKALVRYHNRTRRSDAVQCEVHTANGWNFYIPVKDEEKTWWQKKSMSFILETEKHTYRIHFNVPSAFDKALVLNSLVIEGKQLQFDLEGDLVTGISIR